MPGLRTLLSVSVVAVGGAAAAACVESGDEPVVILQNQLPGEGCVVEGSVSETYLGAGTIEVGSPTGYQFTPVAKNFRSEELTGGFSIAFVSGVEVDLSFEDPTLFDAASQVELRNSGLTEFVVPYAAMIDAGGTTSFIVEILPPELLELMAETPQLADADSSTVVYADVRLVGNLGGDDFQSNTFRYPVQVCNGCLARNLGPCDQLPDVELATGGVCNPLQDFAVDCCESGGSLLCPAVPATPAPTP